MTTVATQSQPLVHRPSPARDAWWTLQRKISRAARGAQAAWRLWRLGWRARRAGGSGRIRVDGLSLNYDDARSLHFEYKHVFVQGLYDFRPSRPDPRILDGGAHIGLSALRFKRLAPYARITAFEPDPRVLPLLRDNLAANGAGDVEVVAAALARDAGQAAFAPDGMDGGTLSRDDDTAAISVPTVRLSDCLNEPVDFLKLNIEGAEVDVVREAGTRMRNVCQLAIEYHGFPEHGERLGALLTQLAEVGFRCVVHAFDRATNPVAHPPFRVHSDARWFALIAATRDRQ